MRALALLAFLLACTGCSSPPEVRYYSLDEHVSPVHGFLRSDGVLPAAPLALLDGVIVDDAFADSRLAYRRSTNELGYDPYSRWAGSPAAQAEAALLTGLRSEKLFGSVREVEPSGVGRASYPYVIAARVHRLEEVDEKERWLAALDLEIFLLDGKTGQVYGTTHFDDSRPTAKRNPEAVAEELSHLFAEAVRQFVAEVRPIIEGHRR